MLEMADAIPNLSSLNLRGCVNFTDMGLTFLKRVTALTCLKIAGCSQARIFYMQMFFPLLLR